MTGLYHQTVDSNSIFYLFKRLFKTSKRELATPSSDDSYLALDYKSNENSSIVTQYYEKQGYQLWNFSHEMIQDILDISYIAKKENLFLLINCPETSTNITLDDIKEFERQKEKFLEQNPLFVNYQIKLEYNLSAFSLTEDAFTYLKERSDYISYVVIK